MTNDAGPDQPTPEEIERRKAWVAKKQADPEFMAMIRESIEAGERGEGISWEELKRIVEEREAAKTRKLA